MVVFANVTYNVKTLFDEKKRFYSQRRVFCLTSQHNNKMLPAFKFNDLCNINIIRTCFVSPRFKLIKMFEFGIFMIYLIYIILFTFVTVFVSCKMCIAGSLYVMHFLLKKIKRNSNGLFREKVIFLVFSLLLCSCWF